MTTYKLELTREELVFLSNNYLHIDRAIFGPLEERELVNSVKTVINKKLHEVIKNEQMEKIKHLPFEEGKLYFKNKVCSYGKITVTNFNWYHFTDSDKWITYSSRSVVEGSLEEVMREMLMRFEYIPKSLIEYLSDQKIDNPYKHTFTRIV